MGFIAKKFSNLFITFAGTWVDKVPKGLDDGSHVVSLLKYLMTGCLMG